MVRIVASAKFAVHDCKFCLATVRNVASARFAAHACKFSLATVRNVASARFAVHDCKFSLATFRIVDLQTSLKHGEGQGRWGAGGALRD